MVYIFIGKHTYIGKNKGKHKNERHTVQDSGYFVGCEKSAHRASSEFIMC